MKAIRTLYLPMILILVAVVLGSCSFTTANYSNLVISSGIESDYTPINVTNKFSTNTPEIYISGKVNNAPTGTVISGQWFYMDNEPVIFIDESKYVVQDTTTSFYFSLSIPDNGWPVGEYSIQLFIDGKIQKTLNFSVE